jgi:hypothetical protein
MGDRNGRRDDKINKIDSEDDSNYSNEPGDYLIPKLITEQANNKVLLELSPAVTL